ncbi:MAG: hypothetical protein WC503_06925 [Candidatus Shapirobacteria bacterium]
MRKAQVAIVVLLVSAVVMTVGLSLSKKVTTDTKIDTSEESLKKAFNAAESGINYFLGTGNTKYSAPDNLSSADILTKNIVADGVILDFDEFVLANHNESYWLVNHLSNGDIGATYYSAGAGTVNVCVTDFDGSLEIAYFYKNGATYGVTRAGYNFSSDVAKKINGFTDVAGNCVTVNTTNSSILLTVTPLFSGGKFYLTGAGAFPVQGMDISSTGKAGEISSGQINKKLRVIQRYKIPYFLLSGVVSENSVLSD